MKKLYLLFIVTTLVVASSCKKEDEPTPQPASPSYSNVKITAVKVEAMPFIDGSGAGWDPSDGPDVYFDIDDPTTTVLSSTTANNVIPTSLPIQWNLTSPVQITNLNIQYAVSLSDYDSLDPNDFIGGYYFTPSQYKNGYPTTITLVDANATLKIVLSVTWY